MDNGWIKLHRKILLNPVCQRPHYLALWVLLLLKANHKPQKIMWNGGILIVKEGQLITGRKQLAADSGIPETTIEDILKFLETQHQIRQEKTTKYRVITILNWQTHQKSDSTSDNKATTKRQQADTNKNVKNEKNTREGASRREGRSSAYSPLGAELIKAFEAVDPKNKGYYANTTQRAACDFLIAEYGLDEALKRVKVLPRTNQLPYFPTITTPAQLRDKWVQLQDTVHKKRSEAESKRVRII